MVYFVAKMVPFVAKGVPVLMAKGGILLMAEIGILYLTIYKWYYLHLGMNKSNEFDTLQECIDIAYADMVRAKI